MRQKKHPLIRLPLQEGPKYASELFVQKVRSESIVKDPESFKSQKFDVLSQWMNSMDEDGYGIVYKIGLIKDFVKADRSIANLLVVFGMPLARKDLSMKMDISDRQYRRLETIMQELLMLNAQKYDKLSGVVIKPPEYMRTELMDYLRTIRL